MELAIEDEPCTHEDTDIEEVVLGVPFGYCTQCHRPVQMTGDENEEGEPGWELCD